MRLVIAVCALAVGCGDNLPAGDDAVQDNPIDRLHATTVGVIPPDVVAASIAAVDGRRVAVVRAVVTGDAFCPDCVDLDPSQCPQVCERTHVSLAVLDTSTGQLGPELAITQVFPKSFDHGVNEVKAALVAPDRVGVAWLDCDNARCGGLFAKQSCTAHYAVVDLTTGSVTPAATLYNDRFGRLQLVANPAAAQLLAVTGMTYGAYGAGVRAAIFDTTGAPIQPWIALGGIDALSPAATATADGFAIVVDDRRPSHLPPDAPCATSCECSGAIQVDPVAGGLYAYELTASGTLRRDPIAIGLAQDGHLPNGHYHAREVLSIMRRDADLVVAATQAIDMEAELFVGRRDTWTAHAGFDSPIPLWLGVIGTGDTVAWLGSQPEQDGAATINRIVAGATTSTADAYGPLTDPLDSHVFEVAPLATPAGITTTFLLRGVFDRGPPLAWLQFEIVEITADW